MGKPTVFQLAFAYCLVSGFVSFTALADEAPINAPSKEGTATDKTIRGNPYPTESKPAGDPQHMKKKGELENPREPLTKPREPLTQPRAPITQPRLPRE
jgi:hypothetical protein